MEIAESERLTDAGQEHPEHQIMSAQTSREGSPDETHAAASQCSPRGTSVAMNNASTSQTIQNDHGESIAEDPSPTLPFPPERTLIIPPQAHQGAPSSDLRSTRTETGLSDVEPSSDSSHADLTIVAASASSGNGQEQPSLEALREKIIKTRGARAQLPVGWDESVQVSRTSRSTDRNQSQPLSSSSPSSSSDTDTSSSDDSSDEDQQAKVDIFSDYDSDESSPDKKATGDGPRGPMTKSELPPSRAAELFGKLPFTSVPHEQLGQLKPLGKVHGRVQEVLVIAQAASKLPVNGGPAHLQLPPGTRSIGGASNERQGPILDAGSLVSTREGKVIGLIFETFGSLLSPLYSILLPLSAEGSVPQTGQEVFYLPSHSTVLRPADLRASQGKASDASNVNDEEAGFEEMEFSDDEEEAEYKRRLKASRKSARNLQNGAGEGVMERGGRGRRDGGRGVADQDRGRGRGAGRGREAGRGRGGRIGDVSSTRDGAMDVNAASIPLPQRPNWQLDEPTIMASSSLSYDEPSSSSMSLGTRTKPRPYESNMLTPAKSPVANQSVQSAREGFLPVSAPRSHVVSGRIVHPLPRAPPSAPGQVVSPSSPSAGIKAISGSVRTSGSSANTSAAESMVVLYPSPAPPPGAHINPLFAHQWAAQVQQQTLVPYYMNAQQQYPPPQHVYAQPQQVWSGYETQQNPEGGGRGGAQFERQQHYAAHNGYLPQQSQGLYWHQQAPAAEQYNVPVNQGVLPSPQVQPSGPHASHPTGLEHLQSSYWTAPQYQEANDLGSGKARESDASYDPRDGRMNL